MFAMLLVSLYLWPKCNKYFNLFGYIFINLKKLLYVTLKNLLNVRGIRKVWKVCVLTLQSIMFKSCNASCKVWVMLEFSRCQRVLLFTVIVSLFSLFFQTLMNARCSATCVFMVVAWISLECSAVSVMKVMH